MISIMAQLNMRTLTLLKTFFVITLFIIFLKFFGLPSLERYLEKKTFFVETSEKYNPEAIPAISIRYPSKNGPS